MACKADVKDAILDMAFRELTDSRNTFSRISDDTIQINGRVDNGKTKAGSNTQARAIALSLIERVKDSFNGHISGFITQYTPYDPVTVSFTVSQAYINHEYNNLPFEAQTDPSDEERKKDIERGYVLNNTGEKSDRQINHFAPDEDLDLNAPSDEVGVFEKFVRFKRSQLAEYNRRLAQIKAEKNKHGITTEELTKLKNLEREVKLIINGNIELKVKGLKNEIIDLQQGATTDAIEYYVQKDLARLDKIKDSEDLEDLKEAQNIINFYDAAGTFDFSSRNSNPFFTAEEIFLEDEHGNLIAEYRLEKKVIDKYREWRNKARDAQGFVDKKRQEIVTTLVNSDIGIRTTFGKEFSFEDLISWNTGLKDASHIDMWVMDITSGIMSHNGILPQVMFSHLSNQINKHDKWAGEIEEKIDRLNPLVQKELMRLNKDLAHLGIIGIKGASYEIFKEVTKEGNETGGIVQRFVKEFFDAQSNALNEFHKRFERAGSIKDHEQGQREINKAFADLKNWRRKNTIIMDVRRIPELMNEPEFSELADKNITSDVAEAHKKELIGVLGERGYKEQVEQQKTNLRNYLSEKQSMIDTALQLEGKAVYAELSEDSRKAIKQWDSSHNPNLGYLDYYSSEMRYTAEGYKINNYMDYNTFIPRKKEVDINKNTTTKQFEFTDNNTDTGNYSENFKHIEENDVLREFHEVMTEVMDKIREVMPYDLQQQVAANTLPGLKKTAAEWIGDKNVTRLRRLILSFQNLWERVRVAFGLAAQSEISYTQPLDPVTGRGNYKVNDAFLRGNASAVAQRMKIEKLKFLDSYNLNKPDSHKIGKIKRFTLLELSDFSESNIIQLADYLHVDISLAEIKAKDYSKLTPYLTPKIDAATGNQSGYYVEIGKFIRNYSLHTIVQAQSFDLGKLAKYFSAMTMAYAARQEALPILEIVKKYYDGIKKPNTNNLSEPIFNVPENDWEKDGNRDQAKAQMKDWFERVMLNNYGGKHDTLFDEDKPLTQKQLDKITAEADDLQKQIDAATSVKEKKELTEKKERVLSRIKSNALIGRKIYTKEDRKKLGEIEELLGNYKGTRNLDELRKEIDEDKELLGGEPSKEDSQKLRNKQRAYELLAMQESLGGRRTLTAALDNFFNFIRIMRLGYNVSSATTNFFEGVTSNMILAASGEYFDPNEIYYGYGVIKNSFIKNAFFGKYEPGSSGKNRRLMDRYNVIMDSKNELQKSSVKTVSSKFSWTNPHEINQRVEYINQSPIMIAMLRTLKIKGKDGTESTIWNAMDKKGNLTDNFRTEENVNNWENLQGEDYLAFKQKLHKAIVTGHGNYDSLRGMKLKSSAAGKAAMMFKTWIPMAMYNRFAVAQDDIHTGQKGYKGRYRSYNSSTAVVHGLVVGAAALGLPGLIAGGALGIMFGGINSRKAGVSSDVNAIKQTIEATKVLMKQALGFPVNIIAGRTVVSTAEGFEGMVNGTTFTKRDAQNMRANMADICMQLAWLAFTLMTKAIFWDDDDEKGSTRRKWYNALTNTFMQLSSQAAMFTNWLLGSKDVYVNTIGTNAVWEYFQQIYDALKQVDDGKTGSGINAGDYKVLKTLNKAFVPGLFKDPWTLGFKSKTERVFHESEWHKYFKSDAKKDAEHNQGERASYKKELEETWTPDKFNQGWTLDNFDGATEDDKQEAMDKYLEKLRDKYVKSQLDSLYPTPSKLKKMGVTREQYEESLKATPVQ